VVTLSDQVHRRCVVRAAEDVGALRRAVAAMAATPDGVRGQAELVATELATNLIRHATSGGYVLLRRAGGAIEMIAVDDGPGLPPARLPARGNGAGAGPRALDAASPGDGGLGVGLAGVQRLARDFDCYSSPLGTVILARVGVPAAAADGGFRWGAVNVPRSGEGESGDGWAVAAGQRLAVTMVDGLGHGPAAAAAAAAAVSAFRAAPPGDLAAYLRRAHEAMRSTRGGVLTACEIDPGSDELSYIGVGNICGQVLLGGRAQTLTGRDGAVGIELDPPQGQVATCRWGPGAALILASDGVRGRWDLSAYPGLLRHLPAVIAATVHRDHARGTDDASVLVVADTRGQPR
jgi:anti-sigma regulatory factor (Ser/Thr protein kinase)